MVSSLGRRGIGLNPRLFFRFRVVPHAANPDIFRVRTFSRALLLDDATFSSSWCDRALLIPVIDLHGAVIFVKFEILSLGPQLSRVAERRHHLILFVSRVFRAKSFGRIFRIADDLPVVLIFAGGPGARIPLP